MQPPQKKHRCPVLLTTFFTCMLLTLCHSALAQPTTTSTSRSRFDDAPTCQQSCAVAATLSANSSGVEGNRHEEHVVVAVVVVVIVPGAAWATFEPARTSCNCTLLFPLLRPRPILLSIVAASQPDPCRFPGRCFLVHKESVSALASVLF